MRLIMVLAVLLAVAVIPAAQASNAVNQPMSSSYPEMNQSTTTDMQPMTSGSGQWSPTDLKARYELGPVIVVHHPASEDVFVGSKWALRIAARAGGLSPRTRARIIANRLNQAFKDGYRWEDLRVSRINGQDTVVIKDRLIATADTRDAWAFRMPSGQLASRWATYTVVAMNGQPEVIASNLAPVQTLVAGSMQQTGTMPWTTRSTKSVPLIFVANGNEFGNGTVAGAQNAVADVNAVAVFKNTNGEATIWTFVPITGTSVSGSLARVPAVGFVSLPASAKPMGFRTGNDVLQMVGSMGVSWNKAINLQLGQAGLPINAITKVVPLYVSETNEVIGAAQIVGSARSVRMAQTVVVSPNGSLHEFYATTTPVASIYGKPSPLNDVVLSSIIMIFPQGKTPTMTEPTPAPIMTQPIPAQPAMTEPTPAPTMTEPATAQPEMTTPQPEMTNPAPEMMPAPVAPAPSMTVPSSPTPGVAPPSTSEQQTTPGYGNAPIVPYEGAPGSGY